MKNLIISMLVVMVVTSCTPPPPDTSAFDAGMEKYNKNAAIADNAYNLFISGDIDAMAAGYTNDAIWVGPGLGQDSLPLSAMVEGWRGWHAGFENFSFDNRQYYPGVDENFIPDGGVRVYGVWNFNQKETGKPVSVKYYAVSQYNDEGQQTASLEWFDQGGAFDQLEE